MENEEKQIEQLSQVLDTADSWLIKFGHISNHAHNRIIRDLALSLKYVNTEDIEYLVDMPNRRVDMTIYLPLLYILWLIITGKRKSYLNGIIQLVEDILADYQIRVSLKRRSSREKNSQSISDFVNSTNSSEGDESDGKLQDT